MRRCLVSVFGIILSFCSTAWGGVIIAEYGDQPHLDLGHQLDSVVGLFGLTSSGQTVWIGSGVVVGDGTKVLTSQHIARVDEGVYVGYSARSGGNLSSNLAEGIFYSNNFAVADPSYTQIGQGRDVAMIGFDAPIGGVTPAALYTGDFTLGTELTIAGYGGTGVVGGPITYDYNKRGFENVLSNFGPFTWTPDYLGFTLQALGHPDFRELGGLLWSGDSGGGWFIEQDGELRVAGLSSSTLFINDFGSGSWASKIDNNWANSYLGSSTAVPEPGSFLLFSLAFGILGTAREVKRRKI